MLLGMKHYRWAWLLLMILLPSLACQAATRLVTGAQPFPTVTRGATPAARLQPTQHISCEKEARSVVLAANIQSLVPTRFPSVDTTKSIDIPLVTYNINGDKLSAPMISAAPDNLRPYQRERCLGVDIQLVKRYKSPAAAGLLYQKSVDGY